ncbi:uncharacterized protein LOC144883453 [Branchiostoma floridae x Branchiostoma japonicum]
MAESKLLNRLSEDFLECQICLQPYRRPKVLSCLHSFCQQCLVDFLKKQKVKTELDCPTCRSKTLLPGGGVAELKDNFFVESLKDTIEFHKKLTNEGESLVCGSCETKSGAESFCTECGDFLCDECVAIHRRIKVTKGHQVIGVEQLKAESDTVRIKPRPLPPCRIHSQETLKLFCIDCSEAICQLCTVLSHKDHKYEYFADTAVKAKEDIRDLLAKTEKKMVDLKNADQQAHAQKTELEKNVTETVENIKRKAEQTRKELVALVNQQEAELLDCVNTVSQTRTKEFYIAIEEIETATVALESAAEFGRNIVEHGSEYDIMTVSAEVNGRLKKLLDVEFSYITEMLPAKTYIAFEQDETTDMAKPRLGEVWTTEAHLDKRIYLGSPKKELEPFVGVTGENFKPYRSYANNQEFESMRLNENLSQFGDDCKVTIRLGRDLRKGEYRVKLYQLMVNDPEPCKFLLDWVVAKGMTVLQSKEDLLPQLRDQCGLDIPLDRCRLRKKTWKSPGTIFLDWQVYEDDIPVFRNWEVFLQVLEEPEAMVSMQQIAVFVRRWFPTEYKLGPFKEIIIEGQNVEELKERIAEVSGLPAERVQFAKGRGAFPCDVSLLEIHTDLEWDPSVQALNTWPLYICDDGSVLFYRDSEETLAALSDDQRRDLQRKENTRLNKTGSRISYSPRKERALKIYTDNSKSTDKRS